MTVQPQMKKEAKCKVRPARSRAAGKSINRCVAPTGHGDNDRRRPDGASESPSIRSFGNREARTNPSGWRLESTVPERELLKT